MSAPTIKNVIYCHKLKKSLRTGNEVLAKLDKILGHAFLNAQSILQEVHNYKAATSQADEKNLVTLMRQAKQNLEVQNDPQTEKNLSTTNLLITWARLLMESSQEALNIILQDSRYGELYSHIEKFFKYLKKLGKRISVSMRHRQVGKTQGKSKDAYHKEGKKKNETSSLRSQVSLAGSGAFCETGDRHFPDQ